MAHYRKLKKTFWTDPKIRSLKAEHKFFMIYALAGPFACSMTKISGIYEIHGSNFEDQAGFSEKEYRQIIKFFNEERPDLLEYDEENHMMYVKNFYKHNSSFKSDVASLIEDFKDTFVKAPKFWAEFGERHRERLGEIYQVSDSEEHRNFLDRLFNLKDEINDPNFNKKSTGFKPISVNRLKLEEQRNLD